MGSTEFAIEYRHQLGARVKRIRKEQRLSQEQLGLMVDLDRTSISRLENGQGSATIDTVIALANALGISPSVLLDGIADPASSEDESPLPIAVPEYSKAICHAARA